MKIEGIIIIACIVAYILARKQLLKEHSKKYVKSIRATLIVPLLQILLFLIYLYEEGAGAAKEASKIDSLHNISTYTPYLGDLGRIADIANQIGLLPDIERSQTMLEFISAATMATDAVNIGILIVIGLALAELYGVLRFGKFSKKQMLMFYGGISATFLICSICVAIHSAKLIVLLGSSDATTGDTMVITYLILTLLMVGIPYIFYKRALDKLFSKHEEELAAEATEHEEF